jgi:hypothetical protein
VKGQPDVGLAASFDPSVAGLRAGFAARKPAAMDCFSHM